MSQTYEVQSHKAINCFDNRSQECFLKYVYSDIFWCQIYSDARYIPRPNISGAHVFAVALPNATVIPPVTCLSFTLHTSQEHSSRHKPTPALITEHQKISFSNKICHNHCHIKAMCWNRLPCFLFEEVALWRNFKQQNLKTKILQSYWTTFWYLIFDWSLCLLILRYILTSIHLFGEVDKNQFFLLSPILNNNPIGIHLRKSTWKCPKRTSQFFIFHRFK